MKHFKLGLVLIMLAVVGGALQGAIPATAPNAPVVSGTTPTDDTTPTWTWVSGGGDGNGSFRFKLDDPDLSSGATETTEISFTPGTPLTKGSHTLYVQERNEAFEWSESGNHAIFINNAAPVLAGAGNTLAYSEDQVSTAICGTLTLTDPDDVTIETGGVQIVNNYANGQDVLAFVDTPEISGSWNVSIGTLTLTRVSGQTPTLDEWRDALRSVTYFNSSENPSINNRTVSFIANDGDANSNFVTSTVTVSAVNDAPVNTVPGSQTVNEDTNLILSTTNGNPISVADADVDGTTPPNNTLRIALTVGHGQLTLSQTTGLTINPGANGSPSMTITGSVINLNAAMNGMRYLGDADYSGADVLGIVTSDLGNTGAGGV